MTSWSYRFEGPDRLVSTGLAVSVRKGTGKGGKGRMGWDNNNTSHRPGAENPRD